MMSPVKMIIDPNGIRMCFTVPSLFFRSKALPPGVKEHKQLKGTPSYLLAAMRACTFAGLKSQCHRCFWHPGLDTNNNGSRAQRGGSASFSLCSLCSIFANQGLRKFWTRSITSGGLAGLAVFGGNLFATLKSENSSIDLSPSFVFPGWLNMGTRLLVPSRIFRSIQRFVHQFSPS